MAETSRTVDPTVSAIMRGFAQQRRRVSRTCAACGAELHDVTIRRRYCSGRCAVRAHRARQRQAQEQPTD
jgi:hypothetical protein